MLEYETSNCPHCFSQADVWFDRSSMQDENGNSLPYEEFPFRCSDCGRNVDAPRSYYGLPEIRHLPFDVYLPGTVADPITGKPLDAQFVETVQIPVYGNYDEDFLTPCAHLIIEGSKLRAMFKKLKAYPVFMNNPHKFLDDLTPEEALQTHDGQRACIALAADLGLYKSDSVGHLKIKRPLRKL
jgi:hypothetical protein